MPPWACEAFDWCEELVVEHDPMSFFPFVINTQSLKNQLPIELYSSLQEIWPLNGPVPLDQLRPWAALFAALTLSMNTAEGIEPNFLRWAKEQQKSVRYLEEPKDVATAFDSVPICDIQSAIGLALRDRTLTQGRLIEMHSAWLSRDLDHLLAVASNTPLFALPNLRSIALENRNLNWLPHVESLLGTARRTLVVVGALHLCGPRSLLQLLGKNVEIA